MEWYYDQLDSSEPLTQENIDQFKIKHFNSGRPYQIGDIVLYGLRKENENMYNLITFHFDEINIVYTVKENFKGAHIFPILIPIT